MIVPMAKVQLIGPRRLLPEAISALQAAGVLQLRPTTRDGLLRAVPLEEADATERRRLEEARRRIDALSGRLPRVPEEGTVLGLPSAADPGLVPALAALEAELDAVEARRAALVEERASASRIARLLAALAPLRADAPSLARAHSFGLALRRDRPDALDLLEQELERLTGGAFDLRWRDAGEERAVLLTVPEHRAAAVSSLLFEQGVGEIPLPARYAGQPPARAALALLAREREIAAELEHLEREASARAAAARRGLERLRRELEARVERIDAVRGCGETEHAFVVAGWAPRDALPALGEKLKDGFGDRVELVEAPIAVDEEEEVPVVLRNPRWLRPFELLLALVPLPRYGSVDPTPWLALFFPLLFGLVLGDLAFGLLAVAAAILVRRRGWGGALGREVAVVVGACGAWAALFGLLFGEALGELGAAVGLHPLVLDRRHAVMGFLGVAIAVGFVHLGVGLVLGLVEAAREGRWREIGARASRLGLLLAAAPAAAWIAGVLPAAAGVAGAWAIVAFALAGLAFEGPLALLEVVLSLGNVLSYARLMALGLASLMLAEAANGIAHALPNAGGVAIAVLLHAVNFSLGLISPAIAALRLQYVEFFEKFYREGGRPYRPFVVAA